MTQKFDVTNSTIIRIILILLGFFFLYIIRDVLALFFFVLIVVAGLYPTVDKWSKYLTRTGAVVLIFIIIALLFAGILSLLIPPLVVQIQEVSRNLPYYVSLVNNSSDTGVLGQVSRMLIESLNNISSQLGSFSGAILDKTLGVVNGLIAIVTVFVMSFYLLTDKESWKKLYKGFLPQELHENLSETTLKIAGKLGAWMRGQIVLMIAVGFFTWIGLLIVGAPYALTLAVLAGILEVIPIIGPWIAAAVGIIVGLTVSPLTGLFVLIVSVVVQQLEGHFLVPKIMSKAVGLNPVIVIMAILIGNKIYGIMGIVIAVPLAAALSVMIEDWTVIKNTFSTRRS